MTEEPGPPDPTPDGESLDAVELRVLGSLIEKQAATPDVYPLTEAALVAACNQKTSRDPIMELEPGAVGQTLRALERRELTRRVHGARTHRWEQRLDRVLDIPRPQLVLLALLFLRGPQTLNELLTRSARMHRFDDPEQIAHHLQRLQTRGLVVQIPRRAGQREDRYMHTLAGPVDTSGPAPEPVPREGRAGGGSGLLARLQELEARVAALEAKLSPDGDS
ncbi:MAG TPA: DUF480 domain-containing protein [Gammaproteobacteria bacterium]|nr:DUF480 domain-containing protein [Gammaproteobacteria bacterium]